MWNLKKPIPAKEEMAKKYTLDYSQKGPPLLKNKLLFHFKPVVSLPENILLCLVFNPGIFYFLQK